MTDDLDPVTDRIAEAGRREVTARLRAALGRQTAEAGLEVATEELDRLAAEAADQADGVLWRRALAGAAAAELDIPLREAIAHPAVRSAHALVGAPPYPGDAGADEPEPATPASPPGSSYEERLAETVFAEPSEAEAEPGPGPGIEPQVEPTPAPDLDDGPEPEQSAAQESEASPPAAEPLDDALRIPAVHLGGIESLRTGEQDLELRFSLAGLDVLKRSNGVAIGRLEWEEIETVELPRARRGLRPGRRVQELHVATDRGRASFELPGLTEEQLKDHLEPMLKQTRGRRDRAG